MNVGRRQHSMLRKLSKYLRVAAALAIGIIVKIARLRIKIINIAHGNSPEKFVLNVQSPL